MTDKQRRARFNRSFGEAAEAVAAVRASELAALNAERHEKARRSIAAIEAMLRSGAHQDKRSELISLRASYRRRLGLSVDRGLEDTGANGGTR